LDLLYPKGGETFQAEAKLFAVNARLILAVTLPLLLSSLVNVFLQFSNTYFMGHTSATALYFVSLYIPISFFLLAIVEGICVTNQVVVAKKTGQDSLIEVPAVSYSLALTGILILALLAGACYAWGEKLAPYLFAVDPILATKFATFLSAMLAASALTIPGMILDSTIRGMGRTGLAFALLLGYAVVYIGLLYHFTHNLGMHEIAIPYAIAISSLFFFVATIIGIRAITKGRVHAWNFFLHPEAFIMLRYVGVPVALSHMLIFVSTFFYNLILAPFGVDVVSGFGVAFRIQTLVILPALTFGEGISILMNQKMGAGRAKDAFGIFKTGLILCFSFYVIVSLGISLSAAQLPTLITSDPTVLREAITYLSSVAPTYCWMGVLLTVLLVLEQTDNGFRAFALNLIYFATVIAVGGWLTAKWNDPRYFYQTIAWGNVSGLLVIAWELRRQKAKFERMPALVSGLAPA